MSKLEEDMKKWLLGENKPTINMSASNDSVKYWLGHKPPKNCNRYKWLFIFFLSVSPLMFLILSLCGIFK